MNISITDQGLIIKALAHYLDSDVIDRDDVELTEELFDRVQKNRNDVRAASLKTIKRLQDAVDQGRISEDDLTPE